MKILHVTAHMGGGVGKVISDLIIHDNSNQHSLLHLEELKNKQFLNKCRENCRIYNIKNVKDRFEEFLLQFDVLIFHWWHHPVMVKLLTEFPKVPVRILLWVHINGCTFPYIHIEFFEKVHGIFFTSPYSYENHGFIGKDNLVKQRTRVVYGLGELDIKTYKKSYDSRSAFNVGYVGTFNRSKIHPDFVKICKKIVQHIPEVIFTMVGDSESGLWIKEEALKYKISDHFVFTGYVEDIETELLKMDVFGYPLNPYHFGTTENAVLEAMAAGLPVVLLNQATEKYIICNNITGYLAKDFNDYVRNIVRLYAHSMLRAKVGRVARRQVFIKYDLKTNVSRFNDGILSVMNHPKSEVSFVTFLGQRPYEWFLSALDEEHKNLFLLTLSSDLKDKMVAVDKIRKCQYIYRDISKSSVFHFASVYPQDEILAYWKGLLSLAS